MINQYHRNPPSRFLDEIPSRLIREEVSGYRRGFGTEHQTHFRKPAYDSEEGFPDHIQKKQVDLSSLGRPKLKLNRNAGLNGIPGVTKGFAGSAAASLKGLATETLFRTGDRVKHAKFGEGVIQEQSGTGIESRIKVLFDQGGLKEFSVAVAPIVKLEENK